MSNGDRISTQDIVVNELPLFTSLAIFSAPAVSGATIGIVTATTSGNEILIFSIENSSELVITPGGVLSFTSSSFTRKESFVATITVSNGDRISTQDIVVENTAWGTITGRVIDGYLSGATVFIDANGDGVHDENEPSTITDNSGNFTLPGSTIDTIVAVCGADTVDKSTGQPFIGIFKAPAGSTMVTPLSTIVEAIISNTEGMASADAAEAVKIAFGIKQSSDILNEDFVKTGSESLNKTNAQVANVINVATVSQKISVPIVLQNVVTAVEEASKLSVQTKRR